MKLAKSYNRELLNDPRTDEFWLPIRTLKMARRLFASGRTCEEIARAILESARDSKKSAIMRLPESERLAIIMTRLEMANPESDEHEDYKQLLARIQGRRAYARRKASMTEAEKEAERTRVREIMRKRRREEPEYMQRHREYAVKSYHRKKEKDPVGYEEMLLKQRARYVEQKKTPEGRAQIKQNRERHAEKRKQRRKEDPCFLEKERALARKRQRRFWARQRRSLGGI